MKRGNLVLAYTGIAALFLVMFFVQTSYADLTPVYKKPSPKKELLKIEEEIGLTKDLGKIEEEKGHGYNPAGKTDPFASFITGAGRKKGTKALKPEDSKWLAKMKSVLRKLREPKTELQTIAISKLKLTGIIRSKGKVWGMVSGPKGRGYILKKGTYIGTNGGVVDKIVSEDKKTDFGMESARKIVIKEPFLNSENEIDHKFIEMKIR